jgi:hypothetical protein
MEERGCSVEETSDGGYGVWGFQESVADSGSQVWFLKTDSAGDTLWTRTYGGILDERCYSAQMTAEGSFIVAAETATFGKGAIDIWLLKIDSVGDTVWTQTYGGWSIDRAYCVKQTYDLGYVLAGYTRSFGETQSDLYVIKTDSLGFVNIGEESLPVTYRSNWEVKNPVGSEIILHYADKSQGFHAAVFDASGRQVDELHSQGPSGTIHWGTGFSPGVYFIRVIAGISPAKKVVLIR